MGEHHGGRCARRGAEKTADYGYWDKQETVDHGTKYVRHVSLTEPLEIVVDGQSRHGVVMRPGKSFGVYVEQIAPFMQLQQEMYSSGAA